MDMEEKVQELTNKFHDAFNIFYVKLQKTIENYDNDSVSIRKNLLSFIDNCHINIDNSYSFFLKKCDDLENKRNMINDKHAKQIGEIKSNYDDRLSNHENSKNKIKQDILDRISDVNNHHDNIISLENENLDALQFNSAKDNKEYLKNLSSDLETQNKEIRNSIEDINDELLALKQYTDKKIDEIKKLFLNATTDCNDKMRYTKKQYVEAERDLRKKALNDIHQYNGQIENNNADFFKVQRQIINDFKHDLLACEEEYDSLIYECSGNQILLLERQSQNRLKRFTCEIEKNTRIRLEKERLNSENAKIKILKADYDDYLAYETKKGDIQSSMEIIDIEHQSGLIETDKSSSIENASLDYSYRVNELQVSLELKRKSQEILEKRFTVLTETSKKILDFNSQLYDISTTLNLDKNQLERLYKEKILEQQLSQNIDSIDFLDGLAEMEYEKELMNCDLENEIELINSDKEKVLANFDHLFFKSRTEHNIEKTRIEHITQLFESKYQKEINTLKNDFAFVNEICQKLRITIGNLIPVTPESNKYDEKYIAISDDMKCFISAMENITRDFFGNKMSRAAHNIEEKIEEYLEDTKEKRNNLLASIDNIQIKIDNVNTSIKENEKEIIYLEVNRNALIKGMDILKDLPEGPDKKESMDSTSQEIEDYDRQLDTKTITNHILKLRQKASIKTLNKLQLEVNKLDNESNVFGKKESQKLFDLRLENLYFANFDEVTKNLNDFFGNIKMCFVTNDKKSIRYLNRINGVINSSCKNLLDRLKRFYNKLSENYKIQIKKIERICEININKEKSALETSLSSISRDRDIAVEEIESKINIIKKTTNENKLRNDQATLKYKNNHDAGNSVFTDAYNLETNEYKLNIKAIDENYRDTQIFYFNSIQKAKSDCSYELSKLNYLLSDYKRKAESDINRIKNNYEIDKAQLLVVDTSRKTSVNRSIEDKIAVQKRELKTLESYRNKKIKEKKYHLDECETNFSYQKKKIENEKNDEIKSMRKEVERKFNQERKKVV